MTTSQVTENNKNPTNGTFTFQIARESTTLEYRADEIVLRRTAFRYELDTTMRGQNVVFLKLYLPLGITGNRDKYSISNADGPVTATCDLKYASDHEMVSFQAFQGEITFYEFDTQTGSVQARFYFYAKNKEGVSLQANGGKMELVGIG
jgi:hypothetical protein